MKQNLGFETEFPISAFLLSILTRTDSRIEGLNVLQTVKILKLVKTGYFGCEAELLKC